MVDLKGGQGIKVFAADNPQLKLYGAGVLNLLDCIAEIDEIELCIVQPRIGHFDRWTISANDLLEWLEGAVAPIAQAAFAAMPPILRSRPRAGTFVGRVGKAWIR